MPGILAVHNTRRGFYEGHCIQAQTEWGRQTSPLRAATCDAPSLWKRGGNLHSVQRRWRERRRLHNHNVRNGRNCCKRALGALESFGARSAEEAAEIWAEGVSAKNGLTQYAVMTDALKERYLEIVGNSGGFLFPTSAARIDAWRITEVTDEADGSVSATLNLT